MNRSLVVHKRFTQNPLGRDWVCGDLHGQYDVLMTAQDNAGFDPNIDRLFLLGDLIDRGPQSAELLSWVLEADRVHSVIGNHELMFIGGATRPGYREKHRQIGGQWADQLNFSRYRLLTTGCANLLSLTIPIETESGSLGLVHAQSPVDDWRELATMGFTPTRSPSIAPGHRARAGGRGHNRRCVRAHWHPGHRSTGKPGLDRHA